MSLTPIYLASDHRGYALKTRLVKWLQQHGHASLDLGPASDQRCDAMDFAQKMAEQFKSNANHFGILICGSGQAMAMTANRYQNLRAALCTNSTMARLAREHNDANILVLGADIVGDAIAIDCLDVFLSTRFLGDRYTARRDRLTQLGGL